jgi:hypothetical protein
MLIQLLLMEWTLVKDIMFSKPNSVERV